MPGFGENGENGENENERRQGEEEIIQTASSMPESSPAPVTESAEPLRAFTIPRKERHDLRNYVGQVLGYSELWLDETEAEGETSLRADLARIHAAAKHILLMINTYIDPINRAADRQANRVGAQDSASPSFRSDTFGYAHWRVSAYIPESEEASGESEPEKTSADALTGRIMIVDDNEANRDLLARRLEQQGHQITAVTNGQEALVRLREQPCDVLLLDILMPGIDGYEVLRRIKQDTTLRHLPVIMISALDEMDSVIRCIEMGADDFLSKPFNPILLRARIAASLEKKRLRDREMELFTQVQDNYLRLKELETLRDDLTHMIVHDLRTPLTSLLTGLQSLQVSEQLEEGDRELLDIATRGGQTLLGMINDLLDVGKMESGTLTLNLQPLQADALIEQALRQVGSLAKEKSLTLKRDIAPNLPAFSGDEEKLVRTLVNLLGNAIKFTPNGGAITVSVTKEATENREKGNEETEAQPSSLEPLSTGPQPLTPSPKVGRRGTNGEWPLVFAVRDTGEGIPREAFERIFQKFGQVETRKAGRKMSTGLGLTFCKMVAEAHGGRIWVESELGQGSAFLFAIPVSSGEAA